MKAGDEPAASILQQLHMPSLCLSILLYPPCLSPSPCWDLHNSWPNCIGMQHPFFAVSMASVVYSKT